MGGVRPGPRIREIPRSEGSARNDGVVDGDKMQEQRPPTVAQTIADYLLNITYYFNSILFEWKKDSRLEKGKLEIERGGGRFNSLFANADAVSFDHKQFATVFGHVRMLVQKRDEPS